MIAHVGDFGLAGFHREAAYSASTNQSSSIGIRGSIGYVATEYGLANEVLTCGDVYSYGILLLEIFTGKRPTDGVFSDSLTLHNFVKKSLPENIAEIVDQRLFEQREMGDASSSIDKNQSQSSRSNNKIEECLTSLLEVLKLELPVQKNDRQIDQTSMTLFLSYMQSETLCLKQEFNGAKRASIVGHHK